MKRGIQEQGNGMPACAGMTPLFGPSSIHSNYRTYTNSFSVCVMPAKAGIPCFEGPKLWSEATGGTSLPTNHTERFIRVLRTTLSAASGNVKQACIKGSRNDMVLRYWSIMKNIRLLKKPYVEKSASRLGSAKGKQTRSKNLMHLGMICQKHLICEQGNGMPVFAGMTQTESAFFGLIGRSHFVPWSNKGVMLAKAGIPFGYNRVQYKNRAGAV